MHGQMHLYPLLGHKPYHVSVQETLGWEHSILMLLLWSDGTQLDAAGRSKAQSVMAAWGKPSPTHKASYVVGPAGVNS